MMMRNLITRTLTHNQCSSVLSQQQHHNHHQHQQLRLYTSGGPPKVLVEKRHDYNVASSRDLKSLLDADNAPLVIDVREPSEVASGRVPAKRYVNIPIGVIFQVFQLSPGDFEERLGVVKPRSDDEIVVFCLRGYRSTWALQAMHEFGFSNSKHFSGGWQCWSKDFPADKVVG